MNDATSDLFRREERHVDAPFSDCVSSYPHSSLERSVLLEDEPIYWRADEAREVVSQLLRPHPPLVSITGKRGSGRTSLIAEVERVLARAGRRIMLRRFQNDGAHAVNELQIILNHVTTGMSPGKEVIVIDDLDTVARLDTRGPDAELLDEISLAHHRDGISFMVTVDDTKLERLAEVHPELAASLHHVKLRKFSLADLRAIVGGAAAELARRAGVVLASDVVESALAPSRTGDSRIHPGLALDRIDAAIGRARLHGNTAVGTGHIRLGAERAVLPASATRGELGRQLRESVRGQDAAVDGVAVRLAPALTGLKLRPERPHGVFLFVGPSGVGKTELAKRIAEVAYGSTDALIRLDMSEYGNGPDGRVKLIGAHRSWKNSSTDGLLTTRVLERPRSVVLLDEFEKSSPEVWPLFLQIFDEGRLTDGWNQTASFAETTIILTSNLGVREATTRTAGFGASGRFSADRQLETIARTLPPELLNRITAIIPFDPLTEATIRELAELELKRASERFTSAGWCIEWGEGVVDRLAHTGYDPAFGARHLHRAIEQEILPLLAASAGRAVRIEAEPDGLVARSVE